MEYYAAMTKKEILPWATTRVDLKDSFTPREISQREGDTNWVISHRWEIWKKTHRCRQNGAYQLPTVWKMGDIG